MRSGLGAALDEQCGESETCKANGPQKPAEPKAATVVGRRDSRGGGPTHTSCSRQAVRSRVHVPLWLNERTPRLLARAANRGFVRPHVRRDGHTCLWDVCLAVDRNAVACGARERSRKPPRTCCSGKMQPAHRSTRSITPSNRSSLAYLAVDHSETAMTASFSFAPVVRSTVPAS